MSASPLFADLNEEQIQAVLHDTGPAMVLAGAGSGKTRVLTSRVAHLMEQGKISPDEVVLLTFTNKAAGEMNERVERLTGQVLPFAGTFHRLAAKVLRHYAPKVGLPQSFVIYDGDDQLALLKMIANELNLDSKKFHPRVLLSSISDAKQQLLSPEEYQQFARGSFQEIVARAYTMYERRLQQAGALDFDNLLVKMVQLLREHEDVRKLYQQQWSYILVDEYQDTNHAQYILTKLLAFPQNNLFVVGDASQAIYGWRGADYRNLLKLKQDFPHLVEYRLERNYRSAPQILQAASAVIKNNTMHPVLELWTDRTDTAPLRLIEAADGEEEARRVVGTITREYADTLDEVAILYRTNAQSRQLEEALLSSGVPYRLVGGVAFYARKEVKDVLAYLFAFLQPEDAVSAARLQKQGKKRWATFQQWSQQKRDSGELQEKPTQEVLDAIITASGYLDRLDADDPEDAVRIENIQELRSVATQFPEMNEFVEQVALVGREMSDGERGKTGPAVTLMSLHAAKGLEFDTVFLVGMEEGLFPHSRALLERAEMEEERRLCYVGITRARKQLYLSYARRRLLYGSYTQQLPSRFIREIPSHLFASDAAPRSKSSGGAQSAKLLGNEWKEDPGLDDLLDGSLSVEEWLSR